MGAKVWEMSGGRRKCEADHSVKVFDRDPNSSRKRYVQDF